MGFEKDNMKKIKQVHGKIDSSEKEFTTLDQIWGNTGLNKYGTFSVEEYTKILSEMNKTDLQAHAIKHGTVPIENRERLVLNLVREFKKHVASFNKPKITNKNDPKKITKKVLDILAEGR